MTDWKKVEEALLETLSVHGGLSAPGRISLGSYDRHTTMMNVLSMDALGREDVAALALLAREKVERRPHLTAVAHDLLLEVEPPTFVQQVLIGTPVPPSGASVRSSKPWLEEMARLNEANQRDGKALVERLARECLARLDDAARTRVFELYSPTQAGFENRTTDPTWSQVYQQDPWGNDSSPMDPGLEDD